MKQPWPSSHDAEIKEQARPKLTQTLHHRTRSKATDEIFERIFEKSSYPLKCISRTVRMKEKFISSEGSFTSDGE